MLGQSSEAMTTTFQQGAGFSHMLVLTIFIGLSLVLFTIWVVIGISKTMKSDDYLNPSEKIYSLLWLVGIALGWILFISTFFRN